MKLITEVTEDVRTITEEVDGKKNLFIEGVFMQAGIKNRNGRVYPVHILENEVGRYVNEKVKTNRALGELNHPASPQVNPERACIRITELNKDGNNFVGKALVLNTPMGHIVKGIMEGEGRLGVSSRGMGTLKKSGMITEVQSDFRLATAADVVSDPSAPDAFVNGIMENVEWFFDEKLGWQSRNIIEETKQAMHKKVLNEQQRLTAWTRFVSAVQNVEIKLPR
jgi:hypothetical protein